jgi:hypothetical protein
MNKKPPYEIRRTCQNCGVPNLRHMFCPKCDKIIYVSYRFDCYIKHPAHRLTFLDGLQARSVTTLQALTAEATRCESTPMHGLAKRIALTIGDVHPEIAAEIFRRGLARAAHNAKHESEAQELAQTRSSAAFRAMAEATVETSRTPKPTAAEKAYADFDFAADGQGGALV